ncbi:amidase [Geminicoccus roseus]|uniref:amidase n=1 Tax=Geminicoccus roseus TaxID=404900 RepID=UPI0003F65CE0|nr:amidase [Geminicoccus roseus]
MDSSQLPYANLVDIAGLIRTKQISPVEVTAAMLERIEALQPRLHAYVTVTADQAMAQAKAAEAEIMSGRYRGPLHGVPIGLKDLCFTKGVKTTGGMAIYADYVPDEDGTVPARLTAAGAVTLGKLKMTEGAYAEHHPTVQAPLNPWNPAHWAGSSSSGSGVATAAGLCYGSIGSDTGGSIRFPSLMNNVTGLKPTWGRVSRHGSFVLSDTLDHLGPMTRCAADAAVMLHAIAGEDDRDPTTLLAPVPDYLGAVQAAGVFGARGLRIGIDRDYNTKDVDPRVVELTEAAAAVLASLGAELVEVEFPDSQSVLESWVAFCAYETAHVHRETYPSRRDEYGPTLAGFIDIGLAQGPLDLAAMAIERDRFKGRLARLFRKVDLVLIPGLFLPGPSLERLALGDPSELTRLLKYTAPLDVSGSPTITLPCGFSDIGVPVGFQLVGPHLSEQTLLCAGHAFQQATDWHTRHPEL